ncbi:MAG: S8 family peptidase [Bacteroidia bacterium]
MKKIIISTLFILSVLNIYAQDDKCDINIRKYIASSPTVPSTVTIPVIAKGNVPAMRSITVALGGRVKYAAGDLISIEIPQNKLADFAASGSVTRMESRTPHMIPLNDTMRVNANVNEIQMGLPPLLQGYDGTGVVMGFIDTGVDFNHPDFKDSLGHSRITWLWDHKLPVDTNTPMPYGYGQEWSNTEIDAGLCTHTDLLSFAPGHGTNSTGIGAGNGLSTGFNWGCAPKADIIMVAYDFNSQQPNRIADGINYIFDKANAMGKPCVINLSLGDALGSFDGRDLEAQMIDAMLHAQTGRLIVSANGNWGQDKTHLSHTVTTDTSWTWFRYDPAIGQVYIQIWGDSADMVNIDFAIGVDADITTATFLGNCAFKKLINIANMPFATQVLIPGSPGDTVVYQKDKVNGVYQLDVNIFTGTPSHYFRLMTKGSGKFSLRNFFFSNYSSGMVYNNLPSPSIIPEIVYYKLPDSLSSLASSFNCLDDVVSVAYSFNRNTNYDCLGNFQYKLLPNGDTVKTGTLVTTSSLGPTRDGRQKPDITASGNLVMAPVPVSLAMGAYHNLPFLNAGCYHYYAGGSSAAAPIVAGIGALYLQKFPNATPAQFKNDIICGAKRDTFTGNNLPDYSWGYGKVNGFRTINQCNFAGMDELNLNGVYTSVQPNPFNSSTTIHLYGLKNDFKNISLTVYDVIGKKLETLLQNQFALKGEDVSVKIDRKQLNSGIYFFTVQTNEKVISKGKLVVE